MVDFSVILEDDRILLHAQSAGTSTQRLVVDDAGRLSGLELYLYWMASTTGASGFISDVDLAAL